MNEQAIAMEYIKRAEEKAHAALQRGDAEVFIPRQFTDRQLGLCDLVADKHGHIWRRDGDRLARVYPAVMPEELAAQARRQTAEVAEKYGASLADAAIDASRAASNAEFAKKAREDGLQPFSLGALQGSRAPVDEARKAGDRPGGVDNFEGA